MSNRDRTDLLLLAAVWGFSFLFMRVAVPEFGAFALAEVRVAVAALFLVAILAYQGKLAGLRGQALPLTFLGAINSAIPFTLFAFAAYSITAGTAAVMNASVPLFGAVIAFVWLKDKLTPVRIVGLGVGFAGVLLLMWDKISVHGQGTAWALAATLTASVAYGVAANYTKKKLNGNNSMVNAAGSLIAASVLLLPVSVPNWPAQSPSLGSWLAVITLGILCTGIAYILYFRLIERAGPAKAVTVTYLVPVFGMLWGGLFLDESVSLGMMLSCGVILLGTALTTGTVSLPFRSPKLRDVAIAAREICEECTRKREPVRIANFR